MNESAENHNHIFRIVETFFLVGCVVALAAGMVGCFWNAIELFDPTADTKDGRGIEVRVSFYGSALVILIASFSIYIVVTAKYVLFIQQDMERQNILLNRMTKGSGKRSGIHTTHRSAIASHDQESME